MKRRRPRAFWMQGLRAARRYVIEFEGVSNEKDRAGEPTLLHRNEHLPLNVQDFPIRTRRRGSSLFQVSHRRRRCLFRSGVLYNIGSVITPDSSRPDLTIVAVSHDRPGELPSGGELNLWGALEERLRSPWQGVEAILHLGGQVLCVCM